MLSRRPKVMVGGNHAVEEGRSLSFELYLSYNAVMGFPSGGKMGLRIDPQLR